MRVMSCYLNYSAAFNETPCLYQSSHFSHYMLIPFIFTYLRRLGCNLKTTETPNSEITGIKTVVINFLWTRAFCCRITAHLHKRGNLTSFESFLSAQNDSTDHRILRVCLQKEKNKYPNSYSQIYFSAFLTWQVHTALYPCPDMLKVRHNVQLWHCPAD